MGRVSGPVDQGRAAAFSVGYSGSTCSAHGIHFVGAVVVHSLRQYTIDFHEAAHMMTAAAHPKVVCTGGVVFARRGDGCMLQCLPSAGTTWCICLEAAAWTTSLAVCIMSAHDL